jgi:hypothetical protein
MTRFYFRHPDTGQRSNPISAKAAVKLYLAYWPYTFFQKYQGHPCWQARNGDYAIIADDGDYIASGRTYEDLATALAEHSDGIELESAEAVS